MGQVSGLPISYALPKKGDGVDSGKANLLKSRGVPMMYRSTVLCLILEWAVLSVLPVLIFLDPHRVRFFLPVLWSMAFLAFVFWQKKRRQQGPDTWGWAHWNRHEIKKILGRFVLIVMIVGLATWALNPGTLFSLMRRDWRLWSAVMLLYPVLSVLPQELIYRGFLFERYGGLTKSPVISMLMSAVSFALAHFFLKNWIAPGMAFIGGLLLADTYARTRSITLVTLEHALYGDFVFTVGLGQYFYHGNVAA